MGLRSGKLTRARVNQIIGWVEKLPNDLKKVAKACTILPADLMFWYAAGSDPACRDPLCVELAWRINEIRASRAAENEARLVKLAEEGDFRAIEKLDDRAQASYWEITPDAEQVEEINRVFRSCQPTPLLTAGEGDDAAGPDRASDPETEGVHPGPGSADQLPGGPEARED